MVRRALNAVRDRGPAHKLTAGGVLLAALAIVSGTAQAGPFAFGSDRTSGFVISSSVNWQTILTVAIPSGFTSGHGHACQAVASLDAVNPGGNATTQYYFFTITQNNANPFLNANGVERTVEMRNQGGVNDPDFWPVSTNSVFGFAPGVTQVIRLLGRKATGAPNLTVDDAHLSIICVGG
jgi:hypothetical protein